MKKWSYSMLTTYTQCPYSFYLGYVKEQKGLGNAWSDTGSFCHEILEAVAKGEMPKEAVLDYFDELFPVLEIPFPDLSSKYNYGEKVIKDLRNFFSYFKGIRGEVLSVERHFEIDLPNGDILQGFIDLETRAFDQFIITDHKISNPFSKKDLPTKSMQLYVYAIAFKQKYGHYPDILEWWHLKTDDKMIEKGQDGLRVQIEFDEDMIQPTMDWVMETINKIEADEQFEATPDYFFCGNLCNHRETCTFKGMK